MNNKEHHSRNQPSSVGSHLMKIAGLLILAFVIWSVWNMGGTKVTDPLAIAKILQVRADDYTRGKATAPVSLIEYSDFQCPACKQYVPVLKQLSEGFPNQLKFTYRYFPLVTIHQNGFASAKAAEAAGREGKFWEMSDMLFDKQSDWSELSDPADTFAGYAKTLGLNADQFSKDYSSGAVKDKVQTSENEGTSLALTGTPSFFLNGVKIENPQGFDDFKTLIIQEGIKVGLEQLDQQKANGTAPSAAPASAAAAPAAPATK